MFICFRVVCKISISDLITCSSDAMKRQVRILFVMIILIFVNKCTHSCRKLVRIYTFSFQTIQRLGKTWDPEPSNFQDLLYSCGSVVWAKQGKFVMWPGMIDFCPDNLTFTWTDKVTMLLRIIHAQCYITLHRKGFIG